MSSFLINCTISDLVPIDQFREKLPQSRPFSIKIEPNYAMAQLGQQSHSFTIFIKIGARKRSIGIQNE